MKQFNTTGVCIPEKHYMVNIKNRLEEIRQMVDEGKYFTINRARQYGKTTTLNELKKVLKEDYLVISISFEGISDSGFRSEGGFVQAFSRLMLDLHEFYGIDMPEATIQAFDHFVEGNEKKIRMDELFRTFRRWIIASDQPIAMLIDEVDSATNNQVFLDFLGLLRDGYIRRDAEGVPAFRSVVLAGVTDVRHLKRKIRAEEVHKENSPWNIASDFNIDMSLSEEGIRGMLEEYEADHHTGMDTGRIAGLLHDYTSGYPFLVSRLCQLIDREVSVTFGSMGKAWTDAGVSEAVKMLLSENNALFGSIMGKLRNYPELKESLRYILMSGERLTFHTDHEDVEQMMMYGFIKNEKGALKVANRIFETRLYNFFLSEEEIGGGSIFQKGDEAKNRFVKDGELDMCLILERFIETYTQVFGPLEEKFREKDGREYFLLYLRPIINGTGNYYIEAQTRDARRTDVIVDYLGKQYIIELKIWRGERYNEDGEKQISEYLDYFGLDTGYMLSFNFNKNKETGVKKVQVGDKILFEGTL